MSYEEETVFDRGPEVAKPADGELSQELKRRDKLTKELHASIESLSNVISPILRETDENPSTEEPKSLYSSKIARIVSDQNDELQYAIVRVGKLARRVEL